ncbi:alpha-ketoglutarate-dependent dioxygenase AlkB [Corynebacterium sp. zg912]|uniref:Alpha-ketoglutarate-dependent dioxygenase AlkB n=1 Tax=Corynebacterium wankanglinii TaxID=2735136 RepID=A0A7H0KA96_9CORY|nr:MULTISPECIES: alpha-ketoglutarate-dependent dioxygenase AlkB [Corynebacterium]MBA1836460.1 alpha-ketoglutarate-dependent dioxygenase AlkB [Corynebacterium wankanglinii]MCR5928457.1 alpha-ketoglutarate-dependent dioxygenase AlkB [Corynebacterium sp. zg912]QNP94212.1 alpha-ketoglutarate-dependent dioxygenase AlkB [Corynebacterium wankanglinii]
MLFTAVPRPPARIIPGAVHLPAFLDEEEQHALVGQARQLAREAAGTPVAMRRPKVGNGQMDAWLLSLGWFWATNPYRMLREVDGHPVPAVPGNFQGIADRVMERAREIDPLVGPTPRIQTALVNFYPPGKGMGLHVDADEKSGNAVVSLSFGQDTVFRIEGRDTLLMSGDAVVFGGPARRARHGVLGARSGTSDLLEGRLNITMRQMEER